MGIFGGWKSGDEDKAQEKRQDKSKHREKHNLRGTPPPRGSMGRPSVPRPSVGHAQPDFRESVARASFGDHAPPRSEVDFRSRQARASFGNTRSSVEADDKRSFTPDLLTPSAAAKTGTTGARASAVSIHSSHIAPDAQGLLSPGPSRPSKGAVKSNGSKPKGTISKGADSEKTITKPARSKSVGEVLLTPQAQDKGHSRPKSPNARANEKLHTNQNITHKHAHTHAPPPRRSINRSISNDTGGDTPSISSSAMHANSGPSFSVGNGMGMGLARGSTASVISAAADDMAMCFVTEARRGSANIALQNTEGMEAIGVGVHAMNHCTVCGSPISICIIDKERGKCTLVKSQSNPDPSSDDIKIEPKGIAITGGRVEDACKCAVPVPGPAPVDSHQILDDKAHENILIQTDGGTDTPAQAYNSGSTEQVALKSSTDQDKSRTNVYTNFDASVSNSMSRTMEVEMAKEHVLAGADEDSVTGAQYINARYDSIKVNSPTPTASQASVDPQSMENTGLLTSQKAAVKVGERLDEEAVLKSDNEQSLKKSDGALPHMPAESDSRHSRRSMISIYKPSAKKRVLKKFFDYKRVTANVFQPPRLIHSYDNSQHDLEVKAGWTELFYDLVYIGAFIRLAGQLDNGTGYTGVMVSFLYMWAFFTTWMSANFYFAAFVFDDYAHQYIMFVHMLGVVFMVLFLEPGETYKEGFAVGYIIAQVALFFLYMLVAIHIKVARTNSLLVMGCMAASIVLWSISCFLNSYNVSYIMWTVGLLTVLVGYAAHSTTTRRKHEDVGYITERLGLFVMLVMGESILGIVLNAHLGDTSTYMIAGFGFFTVFNIHLCYFETIPAEGIENALHSNAIRSQLVYLGHLFACFGLLCVGMGYKTAMKYNETTQSTRNQWIFCGGLALALFAMQIIRTANQDGFHGEYYFATKFRVFLLLVRLTVPIIVATMPLWGLDTVDLILAIFGATSIYVALDIYGHFRYERDLNLVLLNESSNAYLGLEGLEYLQDPFPDLSDFVGWDVVEVRLWMKNDLGAGLESLDKAEKFDITAEKLFRASAAEIIIVFGDKDGGRIVVELSRIASGNKMTGNFDSNVAEA